MTEVLFYHLQNMSLESVLPPLLEKSLERGWRVVVQSTSPVRADALDAHLWTYRDDGFLPHGTWREPEAQVQPVLLTTSDSNANGAQIRLLGAVNYGTVTLKRGMTANSFDLWDWFDAQQLAIPRELRSDYRGKATIALRTPDGKDDRVRFVLNRCLLTKLKAPAMNAAAGIVAIEELQLTYESMFIERGGGLHA